MDGAEADVLEPEVVFFSVMTALHTGAVFIGLFPRGASPLRRSYETDIRILAEAAAFAVAVTVADDLQAFASGRAVETDVDTDAAAMDHRMAGKTDRSALGIQPQFLVGQGVVLGSSEVEVDDG